MTEEWRAVDGFYYEVSNFGSCRRIGSSKRLALTPNKKGYLRVFLWRDGKGFTRYIHRLVAAVFIGQCPDGLETNHKNGVKADNTFWNLEYKTSSANNQHAWDTGLMPRQRKRSTHCIHGHLRVVSVTIQRRGRTQTYMRCRECDRDRKRAAYQKMVKGIELDHMTGGSE